MPSLALSRVSQSVSRNGTCKSNLRGTGTNASIAQYRVYDFAVPTRTFTGVTNINSVSTEGGGAWSNTIRYAYDVYSFVSAYLPYPSLLSSQTSGTVMFRIRKKNPGKIQSGFVFVNGTVDVDGYGVYYDDAGGRLYFLHLDDFTFLSDPIQIGGALTNDVWYHFAIRFETTTISAVSITTVTSFQGGSQTFSGNFASPILPPTGGTSLFSDGTNKVFPGAITDFVFLEAQLSNAEIIRYATAPYI